MNSNNSNTYIAQYRSKGNQVMKFGQVIEDNKRNIFLQKPCRKWVRETSSRPFFFFSKKDLNKVK